MWWLLAACVSQGPSESASPPASAIVRDCAAARASRPTHTTLHSPTIPAGSMSALVELAAPRSRHGRPLDLTLVVDRSGSMSEQGRMTFVKDAIDQIGAGLRPADRLNLVVFDNEACVPLEDWVAERDDLGLVQDAVARMAPRGSTNLVLGLHTGYRVATRSLGEPDRDRRVVLVTDALLTNEDLDANALNEVERAWQAHSIALWTVGVGQASDSPLLLRLAERGGGGFRYLGVADRSDLVGKR